MGEKKLIPTLANAALRHAIVDGKTSIQVDKKVVPRTGELAGRMCSMVNAQSGVIIIEVEESSLIVDSVSNA